MGVFDGTILIVDVREADNEETRWLVDSTAEAEKIVDEAQAAGAKAAEVSWANYARSETPTGIGFGDFYGYLDEEEDE